MERFIKVGIKEYTMLESYNVLINMMDILGKKWVVPLLVILLLCEKTTFSKIKKQLRITSRALSLSLKRLEDLGFVEKFILNDTKKAYYALSEDGRKVTQKILCLVKEPEI